MLVIADPYPQHLTNILQSQQKLIIFGPILETLFDAFCIYHPPQNEPALIPKNVHGASKIHKYFPVITRRRFNAETLLMSIQRCIDVKTTSVACLLGCPSISEQIIGLQILSTTFDSTGLKSFSRLNVTKYQNACHLCHIMSDVVETSKFNSKMPKQFGKSLQS